MIDFLIVLAKRPVAGRVKTRLMPVATAAQAASLAAAALTDTLDVVDRTPARHRVLAFDGDPSGWLRPGWLATVQPSGGLDDRISAAFDVAGDSSALLIGMDTPQLRPAQICAFAPGSADCCLGPALDGGYWAIGFDDASRARAAVTGVPMSRSDTAAVQLNRLAASGLSIQLLDTVCDVDTYSDAAAVARLAPETRFAAAVRTLDSSLIPGAA